MTEVNHYLEYMRELNIWSMMFRICLAMLVGGILGFEREKKGRAAGFRTYMLVCMASGITVILSQYLVYLQDHHFNELSLSLGVRSDISRLAAQIINGVGFLGAGTILVTGHRQVKGLTTAAGLWAAACIGIAIGAGFYEGVTVAFVLVLVYMKLLPSIERRIVSNSRNMCIYLELDGFEKISGIVNTMKNEGIGFYDIEFEKDRHTHVSDYSVLFSVKLPKRRSHAEVLARLSMLDGVAAVEEV